MKNPSRDNPPGGNYEFWFPYAQDTIEKLRAHFNPADVAIEPEPVGEFQPA